MEKHETVEGFRRVPRHLDSKGVFSLTDDLYTCERCGAVVTESSAILHDDWHAGT